MLIPVEGALIWEDQLSSFSSYDELPTHEEITQKRKKREGREEKERKTESEWDWGRCMCVTRQAK